jgi:hypothetical protein
VESTDYVKIKIFYEFRIESKVGVTPSRNPRAIKSA